MSSPTSVSPSLLLSQYKSHSSSETCFTTNRMYPTHRCLPPTLFSFITEFSMFHVMHSLCNNLVLFFSTKLFKFSYYSKWFYFASTKLFSYFKWAPWEEESQKSYFFSYYKSMIFRWQRGISWKSALYWKSLMSNEFVNRIWQHPGLCWVFVVRYSSETLWESNHFCIV